MTSGRTFTSALTLAIETCTTTGSVALILNADTVNEKPLFLKEWLRERSHAEALTPALAEAIAHVGGWSKIGLVAVGVGPGSFTGIRVGLNAARAVGWSLGLPVLTVRSTDTLLEGARGSGLLKRDEVAVAVLPAQMGLVFAAWNNHEPKALSAEDLVRSLLGLKKTVVFVGEGRELVANTAQNLGLTVGRTPQGLDFPLATTVARLGNRLSTHSDLSSLVEKYSWRSAQPLYIRGSGAEEKR